ncbi:MAG: glycoside hydrolase family 97 protein, partial [Wenzhouxiangellaceae bacterium]
MPKFLPAIALCALFSAHPVLAAETLRSPDGKIEVEFRLDDDGQPRHALRYNNRAVLHPSRLGLVFESADFSTGFTITGVERSSFDETWEQPWGEQRLVRDHHNEMRVTLRAEDGRTMTLVFRAFDDGIGFRYELPEQPALDEFRLTDELTEFSFVENLRAWWIPAFQDNRYEYHHAASPIDMLDVAHTPVTFEGTDFALSLHEAALVDYASMTLKRPTMHGQTLKAELVPWADGTLVYGKLPLKTPWRTIQIADRAHELADSRLILNLNEPNRLEDTSWIQPGRYIGIWWCMHIRTCTWATGDKLGATTERTIEYLDFAAEHGFSGVLVEGWNVGWDGDWVADGDKFDFTTPVEQFDMQRVVEHSRKVGVPLIGHHETGAAVANYERQLEDAFALLAANGSNAVKTGYVGTRLEPKKEGGPEWHHGQFMVRHFAKVLEVSARHKVGINAHEPIKDTGLRRTWPHMMTREGARGGEYDAWGPPEAGNHPEHAAVLPFTRMLAGPFDYTPGIVNLRFGENQGVSSTLARQLALMVVIHSPLQMAADLPENYRANPGAFEFIKQVPADWEHSIALAGRIGDHFAIARKDRNSNDWYLGGVSGSQAREVEIALDFLDADGEWTAEIWRDAADAHWLHNPEAWEKQTRTVTREDSLALKMAPGGGIAVR